jgi:aminopeptidase N
MRERRFTGHLGWLTTRDGSVTAAQPDRAQSIFPVNDHPFDKASYSFRLDVPQGITAVANGALVGRRDRGGRTLWAWVQRQPMASHLIQIAVGTLDVIDRGNHAGVELRDVAPAVMKDWLEPALARTPDHLAWLESRVGGYPFDAYGILAADRSFFFALETQTLSLFSARDLDAFEVPAELYEPIMVHELAHQWFGDSVAVRRWRDLWLSEGHATWYEWEYARERFGFGFEEAMRETYAAGNQLRAEYGPVARPRSSEGFDLFSPNVYSGGALVLYALRQELGDLVFREIERAWLREHRGESAGTEDFVALASEVAGRDLGPFLRQWLYETTTPPMPGRPDWTVDPAEPVEPGPPRVPIGPHAHTWLRRW